MNSRTAFLPVALSVAGVFALGIFGGCSVSASLTSGSGDGGTSGGDGSTYGDGSPLSGHDATLSSLVLSSGSIGPTFSSSTLSYKANVPSFLGNPSILATTTDPAATLTISGAPAKSGTPTAPLSMAGGPVSVPIVVTAADGTTQSTYTVQLSPGSQEAFVKPSNTQTAAASAEFGSAIALSADGSTLAIGAQDEASGSTGINGVSTDVSAPNAGAVYVLARGTDGTWTQQAYVKASNTSANSFFGHALGLSSDGSTLVVGAYGEQSGGTGVGGIQTGTTAAYSGAAYVFTRTGTAWSQQQYIKASNARANAEFGYSVSVSADGNAVAVGSDEEASDATGIAGNSADVSAPNAGAAYTYRRAGSSWVEEDYFKASNTRAGSYFGCAVAISGDGQTLAVGSYAEASGKSGVAADQADTSAAQAGAVYVFSRGTGVWEQQVYIKASNASAAAEFGWSVALSADGNTLAAGAPYESSDAIGIGGSQTDTSASESGAAYTFARASNAWTQQAYVKSSNTRSSANFGWSAALSGDGNTLAIGSIGESSASPGVNGTQSDTSANGAGASYTFVRTQAAWTQAAYIKASNARATSSFGSSLAISADGTMFVAGAQDETGLASGINGDQTNAGASAVGASYVFK